MKLNKDVAYGRQNVMIIYQSMRRALPSERREKRAVRYYLSDDRNKVREHALTSRKRERRKRMKKHFRSILSGILAVFMMLSTVSGNVTFAHAEEPENVFAVKEELLFTVSQNLSSGKLKKLFFI